MSKIMRTFTDPRGLKDDIEVTVLADGSVEIEEAESCEWVSMSPAQARDVRDMLVELLGEPPPDPLAALGGKLGGHPMATVSLQPLDEEVA